MGDRKRRDLLDLLRQSATCLLVLLLWLSPHRASADAAVSSVAPIAPVAPIAVTDILARADEDQQRVDWATRLLAGPDPVDRLRQALDDIARPVDAKFQTATGGALRDLPVMRLESLVRHWEFDAQRFERWEAEARRVLAPYAESALQLAQRRAAWSATRAAGLLDGLPAALSGRVDGILAQFDTTEAALGTALSRQIALTQRASDLKARIRSGHDEVTAAIEDTDRRLLSLDVRPLWEGIGSTIDPSALAAMHRGLEVELQFAMDYSKSSVGRLQAVRIVQLLMLPLILWLFLRGRSSRHALAGSGQAARALHRPLSTWVLLSMLAVLVVEPDAPLLAQEVTLLVALIPVLRLLPSGRLRVLGVWPSVAVGLYLLDRLGVAVVADGGAYRLLLLALNLLAMALTVWMLRGDALVAAATSNRLERALRPIAWLVLAVLSVAVIANVAGNVTLAETLTSGVIDSGYMALLLYAGVAACLALLDVLVAQPEIAARRLVRTHAPVVRAAWTRLLVVGASIGWLIYSLDRFRLWRPLRSAGSEILDVGIEVGEVSLHLRDVLVFVLSAWLALVAARVVRRLLRDELPGHSALPRGVGNSVASLSYYAVLLLGLLVALSAAGFKVSQLALVFGALGVGIGFGLQNVVNNFVSGLVLMFERPIQPGDVVETGGMSGTVSRIGLRATIVRTFDGADVVVPNGLLLSGNLTNWTMFDRSRRVEIAVSVPYGADPAQVTTLLDSAARATPGVVEQPAPVAQLVGHGDSGLNFVSRVWTGDIDNWLVLRGDLLARTMAALQSAGIRVQYRQMEVSLRDGLPERRGS